MRTNLPIPIAELHLKRLEVVKRFIRRNPLPPTIKEKIEKEINKLETNELRIEDVFLNVHSPIRIAFVFMEMKINGIGLGENFNNPV